MKKVIFILALAFTFTLSKAQSNLTLLIPGTVEKGYFKQESFTWNVMGLKDAAEADKFAANLKKDTNIKSVSLSPDKNMPGQYVMNIAVNKIYGGEYFRRVMYANGVKYLKMNGETTEVTPKKSESNKAVGN